MKPLFLILGAFFIGVGFIGVFVPGLPTTPFVLLASFFFLKSNKRLYSNLSKSRLFGKFIREFHENRGMTVRQKLTAIAIMWCMIGISIYIKSTVWFSLLLISVGILGTLVMGIIIKTAAKGKEP